MSVFRSLLVFCSFALVSCQTGQHKEAEVKEFLSTFCASLARSETDAYAYFTPVGPSVDESKRALRSLRGWDSLVTVHPYWQLVTLTDRGDTILVELPVTLRSAEVQRDSVRLTARLYLVRVRDQYHVERIDAEELYPAFQPLRTRRDMSSMTDDYISQMAAKRKPYHDRAKELQQTYASVPWFTHYRDTTYYYVAQEEMEGEWMSRVREGDYPTTRMGLVREDGKVVVPPEFDLVGTPGAVKAGWVEVRGSKGYGYYSMDGRLMIEPKYELIVFEQDRWFAKDGDSWGEVSDNKFTPQGVSAELQKFLADGKYRKSMDYVSPVLYSIAEPYELTGTGFFLVPSFLMSKNDPIREVTIAEE